MLLFRSLAAAVASAAFLTIAGAAAGQLAEESAGPAVAPGSGGEADGCDGVALPPGFVGDFLEAAEMPASVPMTGRRAVGARGLLREVVPQSLELSPATAPRTAPPVSPMPTAPNPQAGRDRFPEIRDNPVGVVATDPVSTFSIDVDTASWGFVRAGLRAGALPYHDAVRVEELVNYFPYDYAAPESPEPPFAVHVALMPTPWNDATRLMRIGVKGHEPAAEERPRANLVFLIDTSGSMAWSYNKLPLLIESLGLMVEALAPDDTVAIVAYAGSAGVVLAPTPVRDGRTIIASLGRLEAGGSTAGGEGLRLAYALAEQGFDDGAVNRVILATDGDFNVGISDPRELERFIARKRDSGIWFSALGFGMGNYNDELMQRLAQNGNGNAAYIDSMSEARKALVEEAAGTLFAIAKDVKVQVEFNPARVAEYRLIGYETRLLRREDFSNDKVDAGEIGAGHAVTALYELTPPGSAAARVEPLRYRASGEIAAAAAPDEHADEYAHVRIRYKQPEGDASALVTRPVTIADAFEDADAAPGDARFAAAVAAFGQILRGGRYTGDYGYGDVAALARRAAGEDPFGYRAEFIGLVCLAKRLDTPARSPG